VATDTANAPAAAPSSRSLGLILGVAAVIMFSGSLPANREAVADLSPWFVTAGRATIAGIIAVGLIAIRRPKFPHHALGRIALIALCLVVGFPLAIAVASVTVPSSHGAVILGLLPLATAIAAVPIAHERPSIWFWVLSVIGAIVVAAYALRGGDADIVAGDVYLAFAVLLTGVGYTLSGTLARTVPGWQVIAWALVLTLPVALVAAVVLWPPDPEAVGWRSWAGLVYGGVVVQFVAYACWNAALAVGGVARVGQLQVLQPFFTILIAAAVLGEVINAETVLFAIAIVIIVALSRRTTIRERPAAAG
jgi:drug/metabolite transporter (DMT)-like permease